LGRDTLGGNMTWNHRVIRKEYPEAALDKVFYQIHEVYYDKEGNPELVTKEPIRFMEISTDELRETLERVLRALDKPVLDYSSFTTEGYKE